MANPSKLEEKLMKCQAEKEDLEQRCKRLMQSIASAAEANTRLKQVERDRTEVLHLQNTFRLSWVPDELVNYCSNSKCRAPFTQTKRRHHCRCCGRVFGHNCTDQSAPIPAFGYNQNVRICNPCFALLDEMFCEEPVVCTDPT